MGILHWEVCRSAGSALAVRLEGVMGKGLAQVDFSCLPSFGSAVVVAAAAVAFFHLRF